MVRADRMWMYSRSTSDEMRQFVLGVKEFVSFAESKPLFMSGEKIRCPCSKCSNRCFQLPNDCKAHLYNRGFVPNNYYEWVNHGEPYVASSSQQAEDDVNDHEPDPISPFHQCVYDVVGPELESQMIEEEPNADSRKFFDMLHSLDENLYPGCENESVLSMMTQLLNIKSENHMTERCFNSVLEAFHRALQSGNKMSKNFYEAKKLIQGLGLPVEKIDCCVKGCMLYWRDDIALLNCKDCGHARYKTRRRSVKGKLRKYVTCVIQRLGNTSTQQMNLLQLSLVM